MSRGRPSESEATPLDKWTMECYQYPNKPELGYKSVHHFDRSKSPNGCWRVDHTPAKGEIYPKVKLEKGKPYAKQPVAMVFKTSNNSNARVKIKIWANENIDYIITQDKLPGVPDKAVILELGVGQSLIDLWKSKYGIK
jgi:hypothetical protein